MPTNVREMLGILGRDGWVQVGQTGSDRQFRHPVKPGRVTVAGKPAKDLPREVHRGIRRQAGLKR